MALALRFLTVPTMLALAAHAAVSEPNGIAGAMRPPPGEQPAFVLTARGAQVYECKPDPSDPNVFRWTFTRPDALLYDGTTELARHVSSNQWESSTERGSITGFLAAIQDAGRGNLPWARYRTAPADAAGMFASVSTILRVNTSGGIAPAAGCDALHTGESTSVPFSADFYFYKAGGGG